MFLLVGVELVDAGGIVLEEIIFLYFLISAIEVKKKKKTRKKLVHAMHLVNK